MNPTFSVVFSSGRCSPLRYKIALVMVLLPIYANFISAGYLFYTVSWRRGDTPWRWTTPRPDNFLNFYAHADCGDQQASGKEASKQKNLDFSFWFYCCMHVVCSISLPLYSPDVKIKTHYVSS